MHVRRPIARLALAAGSAVLLASGLLSAACGGDDEKSPTGPSPIATTAPATRSPASASPATESTKTDAAFNACALISKAEVEAAVGAAVLDGEPEQLANLSTCSYKDPASPIFTVAGLSVLVTSSDSDAQEVFDLAKRNAADVKEVDGLGDSAYWDGVLGTLQVVQGEYELSVDVASDEGTDQLSAAEDIARTALSRLP